MSEATLYDDIPDNLMGLKIAIAGTLALPRRMFQQMITSKGGTFAANVDENTDILVFSTTNGISSAKYDLARKIQKKGAKVVFLSEKDFIDKYSK